MDNLIFAIPATVYVLGGFHMFSASHSFVGATFDAAVFCGAIAADFCVFRDLLARASHFFVKVLPDPNEKKKAK